VRVGDEAAGTGAGQRDIEEAGNGLRRAAVGGVVWQGLSYFLGKALVLVSTVILARILTPNDFGTVALALVFITFADIITDLGVAEALVYLPADERRNDAALTFSLLWSATLVGAAMLAAPAVAGFFHHPDITTMFRVLSLSLFVGGTAEVPDAILRKELRFRDRLIADVCRSAGQGGLSVALAVGGFGAWAIVYGYLAGDLIWSAVAWSRVAYRPGRRFWRLSREVARPLLAYGIPAAGNALLVTLVFDIDYLIVGRTLGSRALGFYSLGFRIPQMIIINMFYVLSAVAFPVYSRARGDPDRLRRGYLTSVRLQTAYGVGAGVGLALLAPMLVHVVLGPRWTPAIVPLEALALYAAFRSLGSGAVDVYKGTGRPGLAATMAFVRLAILVPALILATRFGVDGVSWAQAGLAFLFAVLMQAVAIRVIGIPPGRLARAVAPALALGIGAAVGVGAIRLAVPGPESVRLAAAVVACVACGLAAMHLADRGFAREVRSLLPPRSRTAARAAASSAS
jgi:lipopolysaccharide exporter